MNLSLCAGFILVSPALLLLVLKQTFYIFALGCTNTSMIIMDIFLQRLIQG